MNKCTAHGGASESEDYKFDRLLAQDFFRVAPTNSVGDQRKVLDGLADLFA